MWPFVRRKNETHAAVSTPDDSLRDFTRDQIYRAALELVWPVTPSMSAYWGDTLESCDREQRIVDEKRQKFATYEPVRLRREIMGWLDYCDGQIKDARKDIATQASVERMREYDERRREESESTARVMDAVKRINQP